MKKTFRTMGGCLAALLLAGCQNTVNTVENTNKTMQPNNIEDTRFVTDGFLKDRLVLKNVRTSRTGENFLKVQIEATNVRTGAFAQTWSWMKDDHPYKVMYKFDWFDQDGMQVQSVVSNWRQTTVIPGESVYFQGVAPSAACNDFRISVKEVQ